MRRKDREMDRDFALKILDQSPYGNMAMVDSEGEPYIVPLSLVRDLDKLYFHSATKGFKVDLLNKEPVVSISFVGEVRVPDLYDSKELDLFQENKDIKSMVSKVFTTEFESAVVRGQVRKLHKKEDKIHGLRLICEKYTPSKMKYFLDAVNSDLNFVNVYQVDILSITGKRKRFDQNREEMKYGRME